MHLHLLLHIIVSLGGVSAAPCNVLTSTELKNKLLDDSKYRSDILPVATQEPLRLALGLNVQSLVDIDVQEDTLTMNVWLRHKWKDDFLTWQTVNPTMVENDDCDPDKLHANVSALTFLMGGHETGKEIWQPDILLYNTAETPLSNLEATESLVRSDGIVTWSRPGLITGTCDYDLGNFPYDTQHCALRFGSWAYDVTQLVLVCDIDSAVAVSARVEGSFSLPYFYAWQCLLHLP